MTDPYQDIELLLDGKNAFPAIIQGIEEARSSVYINMFIWRDDEIGRRMAETVLAAAERGVQVFLSVDRYGVVLEKCEECKKSFFHKKQTLWERINSKVLSVFYPMPGAPRNAKDEESELYVRIMNHPRITVEKDTFKADHSKYYIIDDEILFLGGINIEDKENGRDMQGRVYQDYMAKLCGASYVKAFREKCDTGKDIHPLCRFGMNLKKGKKARFEMEDMYLSLIREAEKELFITMAYFSPLPRFMDAILDACRRGVAVTVMIPERANFQNDTNRKTVRRLLKKSGGRIKVLLSPKMLHTKLVASEKTISFGSTNITKKAFCQLDELNLFLENRPSRFCGDLFSSMQENYAGARYITAYQDIAYRRTYAFLEGFLV